MKPIRILLTLQLLVTAFSLANLLQNSAICAATTDEDEIVTRGLVFSPPDDLSSRQRSIAAQTGFSLLAGVYLFGSSEDNVYRSPESLKQSSSAFGDWFYLRGDTRLSTKMRMLTTFNWTQDAHSLSNFANVRKGSLSNWMNAEISKQLKISADIDFISENDNAIIITGAPYDRDYGYSRTSGELSISWQPTSVHLFAMSGDIQQKNYNETNSMNSLDWNQSSLGFRYRLRTSDKSLVRLRYSLGVRRYDAELSSLVNGDEVSTNPMERHRYQDGRISFDLNPSKKTSLTVEFARRTRTDLFQGYESWENSNWKGTLESKLSNKIELGTRLSYLSQHFETMTGDNNAKLKYTKLSAGVGSRFTVTPAFRLFVAADYYSRDSNKSTGTLYRDYEGTTVSVGMSLFLFPGKLSKKSA